MPTEAESEHAPCVGLHNHPQRLHEFRRFLVVCLDASERSERRELVAPDASRDIVGRELHAPSSSEQRERFVARAVSEAVVRGFEVVDIEDEKREGGVGCFIRQRSASPR